MNETPNKQAVIVGIFIFVGISFLLAAILIVGNLRETFNKKIKIISLFDDVGGLQQGNNVWLSGVKIGTVNNLNFFGKSQVEVIMNIETKAQRYIKKDAKVKISNDGLIGNKILVIYGGTDKFPRVREGDTLGVEKTFTSEDMINTLQENNKNLQAITSDFKILTHKMVTGEGTIGKFMNDSSVFVNINNASKSLQIASAEARQLVSSLAIFSSGLNRKGTLANELTSDTTLFNSVKASVLQLKQIADTASLFVSNLKMAGSNRLSPIGILLHDEEAGARLKETIRNIESGSLKLDQDLEAAQHTIFLRGFFKAKSKTLENNSKEKMP